MSCQKNEKEKTKNTMANGNRINVDKKTTIKHKADSPSEQTTRQQEWIARWNRISSGNAAVLISLRFSFLMEKRHKNRRRQQEDIT
jgi:hypothetical protein